LAALTPGPPTLSRCRSTETLRATVIHLRVGRWTVVTILSFSRAHAEIACETVSRPILKPATYVFIATLIAA